MDHDGAVIKLIEREPFDLDCVRIGVIMHIYGDLYKLITRTALNAMIM